MAPSILIVEDESDIADLVALHLREQGCRVHQAHDGATARATLDREPFDLLVLDRMLPDGDGLDLCRELRERDPYMPVLMLTARSSELDRVLGLELGADDYMTKPFSVPELVARVKAILRRVEALRTTDESFAVLEVGPFRIDAARRTTWLDGSEIELTAKEFDLLILFAQSPGRVYTREQLLEQVWGYAHAGYGHTVNSHINRLRAKIEPDPARPRYLTTVWGVGYRFFDPTAGE